MTDFARVNNGVAFSGPFTVQNANDMRSNGELLWKAGIGRVAVGKIASVPVSPYESDPLLFGAPSWSSVCRCYISISTDQHLNANLAIVGAGYERAALLCEPGGGFTPPMTFCVAGTGFHYAMFDGNITASRSPHDLLRVSRLSTGNPWSPLHPCAPCKITDSVWVLPIGNATPSYPYYPYSTLIGEAGICRITAGASGALSAVETGTIAGSGYSTRSIASNGTRAIAVNGVTSTGLTCLATGAVSTFTVAMHAASEPVSKTVAYDPRNGVFVLLTNGDRAGMYPDGIMWVTSVDGTTWSASVGWKIATMPFAKETTVEDFTITRDGVWLVICRAVHAGTSYTRHVRYILSSVDGGANWEINLIGLFDADEATPLDVVGFKFGTNDGDGWCAFRQTATGPDVITGTTGSILLSTASTPV